MSTPQLWLLCVRWKHDLQAGMIVIKDIGIRNSEKQAVMKGSSRKVSGSCDTFSSSRRKTRAGEIISLAGPE